MTGAAQVMLSTRSEDACASARTGLDRTSQADEVRCRHPMGRQTNPRGEVSSTERLAECASRVRWAWCPRKCAAGSSAHPQQPAENKKSEDAYGVGGGHAALPKNWARPSLCASNRCHATLSLPVWGLSGIHFRRPTETILRSRQRYGAACLV